MKRFYLLRIVCLIGNFALLIISAPTTAPWHIIGSLAATALLALGLIYELYTRYTTGEEQEVRETCPVLVAFAIAFFVGSIVTRWSFVLNKPYSMIDLLGRTMLYIYVYYLFKTYFESRKNQTQGK